jgi:hypothetical protein
MSSTILLPPRAQLCIRYCSNEQKLITFLNDDGGAQHGIIKHLLVLYAKGDFHQQYLHEHAGGHLRVAAHLINAFIKKDVKYFRFS